MRRLGWRCCIYGDLSGFIFRRPTPSPSWRSPLCATQRCCPSTQSCASMSPRLGRGTPPRPKPKQILLSFGISVRLDDREHRLPCLFCVLLIISKSHTPLLQKHWHCLSDAACFLTVFLSSCFKMPGACIFYFK